MKNMLNSMNLRELFVKKSILSPQEGDFFSKCRLAEKTKSGKYDIKKRLFSNTLKSRYSTFVLQKKERLPEFIHFCIVFKSGFFQLIYNFFFADI